MSRRRHGCKSGLRPRLGTDWRQWLAAQAAMPRPMPFDAALVRGLITSQHVSGDPAAVGDFQSLLASPGPDL
jgi:hypothetical protein